MSAETKTVNKNSLEILRQEVIFQQQIVSKQKDVLIDLHQQFRNNQGKLGETINAYEQERRHLQEGLWEQRGLARCTFCHDIAPGREPKKWDNRIPTALGWGLTPKDNVHYALFKTRYSGSGYESDSYELEVHQLCDNCYQLKDKGLSVNHRLVRDITEKEIMDINQFLGEKNHERRSELAEKIRSQLITENYYDERSIHIMWRNLPIPEAAYEVGENLELDKTLNGLTNPW